MPEITTRKEALAQGLKKYYTGKTCPKGHLGYRYVRNYTCCLCIDERQALEHAKLKKIKNAVKKVQH